MRPHIEDVLLHALTQDGDRYVLGAETRPDQADPNVFDCSELVQWSTQRAGLTDPAMPDGSWIQAAHCRDHRTLIPIEAAITTRGALLFRTPNYTAGHVAISLGDGRTIEARGSKWGVGVFPARGRTWTHGATIPGVDYSPRKPLPPKEAPMNLTEADRSFIEAKLFATGVAIVDHVLDELNPRRDPDNTIRDVAEATYNAAHAAEAAVAERG